MCMLVYMRACMHMDGWMDGWLQAVGVGVSFRVMDLGWKLPCIVRIFFFYINGIEVLLWPSYDSRCLSVAK